MFIKWLAYLLLPRERVRLVRVDSPDLSLETWRASEQLVSEWGKVESQPIYRAFVQTMRNEAPVNTMAEAPTADEKIRRLGVIEGYQLALNNLEAFGKLSQRTEMPESTFEKTEEQPTT
jgi:hypothetical protein